MLALLITNYKRFENVSINKTINYNASDVPNVKSSGRTKQIQKPRSHFCNLYELYFYTKSYIARRLDLIDENHNVFSVIFVNVNYRRRS